MSSLTRVIIHESIHDVDKTAWRSSCPDSTFCQPEYFQALESSGLPCRYLYATGYEGQKIICMAVATIWPITIASRLSFRVCTLGTPLNTGLAVLTRSGDLQPDIILAIMQALAQRAREQGVRIFVGRDFGDDFPRQEQLIKLYDCATLDIRWANFNDYVSSLPNPKSTRRDIKSLTREGYHVEVARGSAIGTTEADCLLRLWLQLYNKHRSPDQIMVTASFFQEISRLEHCIFFLLRKNDQIHAFDVCFALGKTLESTYCGVNLVELGRLPAHRVMGHEIVRHAIENGFEQVNFGISNLASKVAMGCRRHALHGWLQVTPAWGSRFVRWVMQKHVIDHE